MSARRRSASFATNRRKRVLSRTPDDREGNGTKTRRARGARPPSPAGLARLAADLAGARRAGLPRDPRPQLATLVDEPPSGAEWLHEIKYDGYRLLALVERGRARLSTRHGGDWTARFPGVADALAALPVERAVVDGEVVVLDARGVPDFQALQNSLRGGRVGHVFFAFDLLHCAAHDLTAVPLVDRKRLLEAVLAAHASPVVRYSDHVAGDGPAFLRQACLLGLEGSVSKRADATYLPRRSSSWVKAKCTGRQEFVVGGWTDPAGARSHLGALLLGVYDDEQRLRYAGRVGAGFSERSLAELARVLGPLAAGTSPFVDPPRGAAARGVHYVRPERVAEVAFTGWTSDGLLRHPVFEGLREDKSPREIRRERPRARSAAGAQAAREVGAERAKRKRR